MVADALNMLPIHYGQDLGIPIEYINLVEILSFKDVSLELLKETTAKDRQMSHLKNCLKFGWSQMDNVQL